MSLITCLSSGNGAAGLKTAMHMAKTGSGRGLLFLSGTPKNREYKTLSVRLPGGLVSSGIIQLFQYLIDLHSDPVNF